MVDAHSPQRVKRQSGISKRVHGHKLCVWALCRAQSLWPGGSVENTKAKKMIATPVEGFDIPIRCGSGHVSCISDFTDTNARKERRIFENISEVVHHCRKHLPKRLREYQKEPCYRCRKPKCPCCLPLSSWSSKYAPPRMISAM